MSSSSFVFLREYKQGLGLNNSSFKTQDVLQPSIFSWVFQDPVVPGVDIEN
jgi:hypothetical protein